MSVIERTINKLEDKKMWDYTVLDGGERKTLRLLKEKKSLDRRWIVRALQREQSPQRLWAPEGSQDAVECCQQDCRLRAWASEKQRLVEKISDKMLLRHGSTRFGSRFLQLNRVRAGGQKQSSNFNFEPGVHDLGNKEAFEVQGTRDIKAFA